MRKGPQRLSSGTGVLYERSGRLFIATAWHNLTGRHTETLRPISPTGGLPDNVVATIPQVFDSEHGTGVTRMSFVLPVEDDCGTTCYLVHPQGWPRVDVAVLPIDPDAPTPVEMHLSTGRDLKTEMPMRLPVADGSSTVVQPIQACAGAFARVGVHPDKLIDAGDDLFVLGYPRGISDFSAAPIWKRATVASDPHNGWNRQPKFLIDCASREGMSGAPVVQYSRDGTVRVGGHSFMGTGPAAVLQGVYVGRLIDEQVPEDDRLFEAQIGTVWKRQVIDEIIDAELPGQHSGAIGASSKAIEQAVLDRWPQDPTYFEKVLAIADFRWEMVGIVLTHLNGNANPADVNNAVLAHAQNLQAVNSQQ